MGTAFLILVIPYLIMAYVLDQKEKGKEWAIKLFPWSLGLIGASLVYIILSYLL